MRREDRQIWEDKEGRFQGDSPATPLRATVTEEAGGCWEKVSGKEDMELAEESGDNRMEKVRMRKNGS